MNYIGIPMSFFFFYRFIVFVIFDCRKLKKDVGGAALTLEGGRGMRCSQDSLFQASPGDPPFQTPFQLQRPHFNFFEKIRHFKTNFCQF